MTKPFAQDLEDRINASRRMQDFNYWASYITLGIGVAAGAIATISVAAGGLTKELNAVLAAIPAIIMGINKTFPWEARSYWWRDKAIALEGFQRELAVGEGSEKEVNQKLTAFLHEHKSKWPGAGSAPPV